MVWSRNGYGKARKLTTSVGTVTVPGPQVREVEEQFESRVLPLFPAADQGSQRPVTEALPA